MNHDWYWSATWCCISALITVLAGTIGVAWMIRPLRRLAAAPWYERARFVQPTRAVAILIGVILMPISIVFGLAWGEGIKAQEPFNVGWAGAIGAIAGASWVCFRLTRRLHSPRITFGYWLCGVAVLWILFLGSIMVLVAIVMANVPDQSMTRTVVLILLGLPAVVFFGFGGGMFILRLIGIARPASARLVEIVSKASARCGVAPAGAFELRWHSVNALAIPWLKQIAVSDAALAALSDDQLEAVCVHELAHLSEPLSIRWLRTAGSLLPFLVLAVAMLLRSPLWVGLAPMVYLLARLLMQRLSRRLEVRADAAAAQSQAGQLVYAQALERLYETNLVPLVGSRKGGSHPHAYDRLIASGYQPPFPRPQPPPRGRSLLAIMLVLVISLFLNLSSIVVLIIVKTLIRELSRTQSIGLLDTAYPAPPAPVPLRG